MLDLDALETLDAALSAGPESLCDLPRDLTGDAPINEIAASPVCPHLARMAAE